MLHNFFQRSYFRIHLNEAAGRVLFSKVAQFILKGIAFYECSLTVIIVYFLQQKRIFLAALFETFKVSYTYLLYQNNSS